jgi:hypothetical protein
MGTSTNKAWPARSCLSRVCFQARLDFFSAATSLSACQPGLYSPSWSRFALPPGQTLNPKPHPLHPNSLQVHELTPTAAVFASPIPSNPQGINPDWQLQPLDPDPRPYYCPSVSHLFSIPVSAKVSHPSFRFIQFD